MQKRFSLVLIVQTGSATNPASYTMDIGTVYRGQSGRSANLTMYIHFCEVKNSRAKFSISQYFFTV
jgi:hypothetical protein